MPTDSAARAEEITSRPSLDGCLAVGVRAHAVRRTPKNRNKENSMHNRTPNAGPPPLRYDRAPHASEEPVALAVTSGRRRGARR